MLAKSERRARYARQLKGIDHRTSLLDVRQADGSLTEEMQQELGASFSKQRGCPPQLPVIDRKANKNTTQERRNVIYQGEPGGTTKTLRMQPWIALGLQRSACR
jgi:hypothetical protein